MILPAAGFAPSQARRAVRAFEDVRHLLGHEGARSSARRKSR